MQFWTTQFPSPPFPLLKSFFTSGGGWWFKKKKNLTITHQIQPCTSIGRTIFQRHFRRNTFDLTLEIWPSYFGHLFLEEQAQVALSSLLLLVPALHKFVQAWKSSGPTVPASGLVASQFWKGVWLSVQHSGNTAGLMCLCESMGSEPGCWAQSQNTWHGHTREPLISRGAPGHL